MPIVDVQVVSKDRTAPDGLAQHLVDAVAQVLASPPSRVWLRLSVLPAENYAENGAPEGANPLPVFVRVLHADLPSAQVLATQAQAISQAVALNLSCPPQLVHVEYAPAGRGRIAFGGKLLA